MPSRSSASEAANSSRIRSASPGLGNERPSSPSSSAARSPNRVARRGGEGRGDRAGAPRLGQRAAGPPCGRPLGGGGGRAGPAEAGAAEGLLRKRGTGGAARDPLPSGGRARRAARPLVPQTG